MNIAALPTYDSYKDSGVQWIGVIPSHWLVERSKWLFHDRKERARKGEPQLAATQKYGVIPQSEFMELEGRRVTQVFLDFTILKHVEAGDFVMSMRSFQGGLEYSEHTGCVSSAYVALEPQGEVFPPFYKYLLKSTSYIEALQSTSNLVRDGQALRFENFSMVDLFAPPLPEQRAIAAFLDGKCAKIDEAVRIKEKQIKLLTERRQILIQQAVTRGLNPDAPMKDSGIDWIGQIPAHWEVKRFTKEINVQEGPGIMAVDFHESGVPLIRISGVRGRKVTLDGCNYLSPVKARRKWDHFKLSEGDLVISGSASTGFVAEVGPEAAGAILYTGLMKLRIKHASIEKRYLEHFLSSDLFAIQVELLKAGSTIAHYGPSHLGRMFVVLPPIDEQPKISAHCDETNASIGEAISIKEDQIAALKEYKTSLINAAVTGKIKVI